MKPIAKHIVYDWNSTLFDDVGAIHGCTNRLLESVGFSPVSLDFYQERYEVPFQKLFSNLGLDATQIELVGKAQKSFHDHYEPEAAKADLRDGAREILDHAQSCGIKNYILSNHLVEPISIQLRRLGINHLFSEILAYADRSTQFKDMTKGERLRRFRASAGISHEPTVIVGDSIEEIEIAREQGFISVALTGGCVSERRLREANPDYLIHSLWELPSVLRERGFVS